MEVEVYKLEDAKKIKSATIDDLIDNSVKKSKTIHQVTFGNNSYKEDFEKEVKQFINETELETKRKQYNKELEDIAQKFKTFTDASLVQLSLFSVRQELVELYAYYSTILAKITKEIKSEKVVAYEDTKIHSNIKTKSFSEIDNYIAAATSDYGLQKDLLDTHLQYLLQTIKTVDYMLYGVSNRIKIEDMIGV